jgi:hypothetical protein
MVNKIADPLFADRLHGDFTLQIDSPAIGFAVGGGDSGAYQVGSTPPVDPADPPAETVLVRQAPATLTIKINAKGTITVRVR